MTVVPEETLLDLVECRPHEYEGRIVILNGVRYRIGPWIGQGGEKIVHPLTNIDSGLTLHVIKVFRDQERIRSHAAGMVSGITELRRYFGNSVPNFLIEQSHNGWFEVQDVVAALLPAQDSSPATAAYTAGASAEGNGRPEEALGHYEDALRLNPHHSHALVGVARVQAQLGRPAEAIVAHEKALAVEPNCCGYYLSLAVLAYQVGLPFKTIEAYEAMKRLFPYQEDIDEAVAAALLACGQPEEALQLLHDSGRQDLDEETVIQIRERAASLQEARRRASEAWQRASEAVVARDATAMRCALDEALSLDPADPWLAANDALMRVQLDQPDAQTMLMSALRFLPAHFHQACRVSLAFHAQLADPDSKRAWQLIGEIGSGFPALGALPKQVVPVPAALWLDLDGLQCAHPAVTADVLGPAAERAFASTGDPRFRAVAGVYGIPDSVQYTLDEE